MMQELARSEGNAEGPVGKVLSDLYTTTSTVVTEGNTEGPVGNLLSDLYTATSAVVTAPLAVLKTDMGWLAPQSYDADIYQRDKTDEHPVKAAEVHAASELMMDPLRIP